MKIIITVEDIDPELTDSGHEMGITAAAFERLLSSLSWLGDVENVEQDDA